MRGERPTAATRNPMRIRLTMEISNRTNIMSERIENCENFIRLDDSALVAGAAAVGYPL
jgi:hypothetical protein